MKQKITKIVLAILLLLFIAVPLPASGVKLRMTFTEPLEDPVKLYYATNDNPTFSEEQSLVAEYNEAQKRATFSLDSNLVKSINCLRFDLPEKELVISIKDVSVSSAGLIKRHFNPCDFFADDNIDFENDFIERSTSPALGMASFHTGEKDPYVVFSNPLLNQILKQKSRYYGTRILIVLFLLGCHAFHKNHLFTQTEQED